MVDFDEIVKIKFMKKQLTLCIPVKDGKILLGMKKRGFGAGRWNGSLLILSPFPRCGRTMSIGILSF